MKRGKIESAITNDPLRPGETFGFDPVVGPVELWAQGIIDSAAAQPGDTRLSRRQYTAIWFALRIRDEVRYVRQLIADGAAEDAAIYGILLGALVQEARDRLAVGEVGQEGRNKQGHRVAARIEVARTVIARRPHLKGEALARELEHALSSAGLPLPTARRLRDDIRAARRAR